MGNIPGLQYTGAHNHIFVVQHIADDRYVMRNAHPFHRSRCMSIDGRWWTTDISQAQVFTWYEARSEDVFLPSYGRWFAIGRRIPLDDKPESEGENEWLREQSARLIMP